jgi:threonine/homoserine efflux transporter RhtA
MIENAREELEKQVGTTGIAGMVVTLAGLVLVALKRPVVGSGLALVVTGLCLLAYGASQQFMKAMGIT